jgi:hypothetical protein
MAAPQPAGAAAGELALRVAHGRSVLDLQLEAAATVGALKALVASSSGLLARNMTLIHKGKKLERDAARLADCGVASGARLMVLAGAAGSVSTVCCAAAAHLLLLALLRQRCTLHAAVLLCS